MREKMSNHRLVGKYVHVIVGGVKIAEGIVLRVSGTVVGSFVHLDTEPAHDPSDPSYDYGTHEVRDCKVVPAPNASTRKDTMTYKQVPCPKCKRPLNAEGEITVNGDQVFPLYQSDVCVVQSDLFGTMTELPLTFYIDADGAPVTT
jgi:hypothetical protein